MIAISSLNDQYVYRSFCTSGLVDGQTQNMKSDGMSMCSSSSAAIFISSAVMQSGFSVHDCIALMVMNIPGISSSLSHGCVWIASL